MAWGSILSGGVQLLGGILDNKNRTSNTKRTNRANADINRENLEFARETNEGQYRQAKEFFGLNVEQTEKMYERQRNDALHDYWRQREDSESDYAQSFVRMRQAAEAAGFNPLTALGGGGAPGMTTAPISTGTIQPAMLQGASAVSPAPPIAAIAPALSSIDGLRDIALGVADAFFPEKERAKTEATAHAVAAKPKAQQLNNGEVVIERTTAFTQEELDAFRDDTVYMRTPTYDQVQLPRGWVQAVGLKPGDIFLAEHAEMIGGDVFSEVLGAINGPAAISIYYGGKKPGKENEPWALGDTGIGRMTNRLLFGQSRKAPAIEEPRRVRPHEKRPSMSIK